MFVPAYKYAAVDVDKVIGEDARSHRDVVKRAEVCLVRGRGRKLTEVGH